MRNILLLIACLFVFISARAQEEEADQQVQKNPWINWAKFNYGATFGFNISNIRHGDFITGNDLNRDKLSVNMGLLGEYKINDLMGIQMEFQYSRQGGAHKRAGLKEWVRVNYFNIPVLYTLYIKKFSINVGPQVGFAINAKSKTKSGKYNKVKATIDDLNPVDFSAVVGVNYELPMHLFLSARYALGFTNVFDPREVYYNNQNRVLQIGFGWKFKQ